MGGVHQLGRSLFLIQNHHRQTSWNMSHYEDPEHVSMSVALELRLRPKANLAWVVESPQLVV